MDLEARASMKVRVRDSVRVALRAGAFVVEASRLVGFHGRGFEGRLRGLTQKVKGLVVSTARLPKSSQGVLYWLLGRVPVIQGP